LLSVPRPTDSPTIIAVSLVMAVVAVIACYVPASRAMRVDPMVTLRYE
jgi:putative ABC transport system permease protein